MPKYLSQAIQEFDLKTYCHYVKPTEMFFFYYYQNLCLNDFILQKVSRTSPFYKLCTSIRILTWKCQNKDETSREIQLVEIRRLILIILLN